MSQARGAGIKASTPRGGTIVITQLSDYICMEKTSKFQWSTNDSKTIHESTLH